MLYGSKVIKNQLNEKFVDSDVQIQVLSLGFGVGILERVLENKFNDEILSVEKDRELEGFGEAYFSSSIADEWEGLNVIYKFDAGDVIVALRGIDATNQSIDLIEACDPYKSRTYDLVFVDMIDLDIYPMVGACAPPRGFIYDLVFNNINHLLHQQGALVIYVIATDCFFEMDLKILLENHFLMIYKLRFEEDFEFVIIVANSINFATNQENEENEAFGIIKSLVTQRFHVAKFKGA